MCKLLACSLQLDVKDGEGARWGRSSMASTEKHNLHGATGGVAADADAGASVQWPRRTLSTQTKGCRGERHLSPFLPHNRLARVQALEETDSDVS